MELTILILLLPFFSFLILGIGGKWMSHRTAGTIGTLILGAVAVLSYVTAFQYFSAPQVTTARNISGKVIANGLSCGV